MSFRKEIAPLLHRRCAACHGEESAKGGYRLDSYARLLKAGESELAPLTPGSAEKSELYQLLIESDPNDRMPQRADALPKREVALVERWINEGATNDGGPPDRPLTELVRESFLLPAPEHYSRPVPVTALAFSPDGAQLAVAGYYEITLWNVDDGALIRRIGGLPERITSIAWQPKLNLLAVAGGSPSQWGAVWLIDPVRNFEARILYELPETLLCVAFSPDGKRLAAGGGDRTIRLFELPGGKRLRVLKQHADWVQTIAFSADSARFISASRDRTARIFDTETGDVRSNYSGHEAPVIAAVIPPRSLVALSVARGQAVRQWDGDGKQQAEFADGGRGVQVMLPLDSGLLAGTADGSVRLLRYKDQGLVLTFFGHRDYVESLAVAPDRRTFAGGDHSGVVCVWSEGCEAPIKRFVAKP